MAAEHETNSVELAMTATGHVEVHGALHIWEPAEQRLEFAFTTDQTALRELFDGLLEARAKQAG